MATFQVDWFFSLFQTSTFAAYSFDKGFGANLCSKEKMKHFYVLRILHFQKQSFN